MEHGPSTPRGRLHPAEIPIGWWTVTSLLLLGASVVVFIFLGDGAVGVVIGGGLLALSMGASSVTNKLIRRAMPDSVEERP